METLILLSMILITAILTICVYLLAYPPKPVGPIWTGHGVRQEDLYLCKDIICKYGQEYCCMSCGQRNECEAVCEYEGSCDWRVKYE